MIPYAGYDRTEGMRGYYPPQRKGSTRAARRAMLMFRAGLCTREIAAKLDCTEQRALKLVTIGRSRALGLPSPYEVCR